jgi:hypothetical protein
MKQAEIIQTTFNTRLPVSNLIEILPVILKMSLAEEQILPQNYLLILYSSAKDS